MRRALKRFQPEPIEVERILQRRGVSGEERPWAEIPPDDSLEGAVARMTRAARSAGRGELVLSQDQWARLVINHLDDYDIVAFSREKSERVGPLDDLEELNHWVELAINIWSNTPQPDKGGKSARELSDSISSPADVT